MDKLTPFALE